MKGFSIDFRTISLPRLSLFAVIIAVGWWLRCWRVGEMLVFADEIHSLGIAVDHGYSWIASHFAESDACIPLTLYNKALLDTVGLTEWTLRLPSLLAGLALLPLVAFGVWRFFSFESAILLTGLLSFSPYFVYLSREARPYSIIALLFGGALLLVFAWRRTGGRYYLEGAAILCGLAAYFHPVVLPAVFILGCFPLAVLFGRRSPQCGWGQYLAGLAVFTVLLLLLLGPPALSLLSGIMGKGAKGTADAGTVVAALPLIFSLPFTIPALLWLALAAIGIADLSGRYRLETVWLVLLLGGQTLALHVAQPELLEVPWVWLRYQIHLLPVFLLLCGTGLLTVLRLACSANWCPVVSRTSITALLLLFCVWQLAAHRYGVGASESFNAHPMAVYLAEADPQQATIQPPSDFYRRLGNEFEADYLVEAPMLFTLPLYGLYQVQHGRPLRTAGLGDGFAQKVFAGHPGFRFRTIAPVALAAAGDPVGSGLLIVHKRIKAEIRAAYDAASRFSFAGPQLRGIEVLFREPLLSILFGPEPVLSDSRLRDFTPLYEDQWLVVYRLAAH